MNSDLFKSIFVRVIQDYHIVNNVEATLLLPYYNYFENTLYEKCWIDTIQWHLEDIIRSKHINANYALDIKREIDLLNHKRVELVEKIEDYFVALLKDVKIVENPKTNTETIGWAIDRLSILQLKLYHANEKMLIKKNEEKRHIYGKNLLTLSTQDKDLSKSIDNLIDLLKKGEIEVKTYRQIKMYG